MADYSLKNLRDVENSIRQDVPLALRLYLHQAEDEVLFPHAGGVVYA